jgi:EAL domain-containing protein (putative c-di-GMP-specific phosphodiesterase class I)/GGDEF domain-containing protein
MPARDLIESLPELVLQLRRDGSLVAAEGGRGITALQHLGEWHEGTFTPAWPAEFSTLLAQLSRRTIADRNSCDARAEVAGQQLEIRAMAQGADRCICVVRAAVPDVLQDRRRSAADAPPPELDRRGFLRRLKDALAVARLREKPLAVAIIRIEDVTELGRVTAAVISEQIIRSALANAMSLAANRLPGIPQWQVGQLKEDQLGLWIDSADRGQIEAVVDGLCTQLREPVALGQTQFRLELHAGIAILGVDAATPQSLLDHAAMAAAECRRAASRNAMFFSDTLKMRSLARLDVAREMRSAIDQGHFRLRYRARHDLATGVRTSWVGYIHWSHPLRGSIAPREFLPVAQTMGLAKALSRSVLASLQQDFAAPSVADRAMRLSFGALRAHALDPGFLQDMRHAIIEHGLPAERLEIRLAESAVVSRDPAEFAPLRDLGVQLVADEMGRDVIPLPRLAGAPVWGLQIDRRWAAAVVTDPLARRICTAVVGLARSLGFIPLASGIDSVEQLQLLQELGCIQGTGNYFTAVE